MFKKAVISGVILCMALVIAGCASLEQSGLWKQPKLKFGDARITALDFSGFSVDLDLDISNPNAFQIAYGAMEYKLNLQDSELVSGKLAKSGNIGAGKTGKVTLPLSFKFADLLDLAQGAGTDKLKYGLDAAMLFNIPAVGEVKLPVKTEGSFPVPKMPSVSISSFNITDISMTGANIRMEIEMENPNLFDLIVQSFNYGLALNGKSVVSGKVDKKQTVKSRGKGSFEIPVQLSFLQGGLAIYNMLTGSGDLKYDLDFNSVLGSNLPILKNLPVKFEEKGTLNLSK